MKIIFFGSSHFALPSLEALIKSRHEVSCVVTQPDKKKGRHLRLAHTLVKETAQKAGLCIFQPENVNTADSLDYLAAFGPDLFVVVAYGQLLSQKLLDTPRVFAINLHASLLPKYRGAAPVNWALIRGEKHTGVSVIKLTRDMDAGPLLLQKETAISDNDDALTLENRLSLLAAELLLDALKQIEAKSYKLLAQDEKKVVMAPKLKKSDGCINWNKPAAEIRNLIRASLPWPGAFTYYKGKLLKIYRARVLAHSAKPAAFMPGQIEEASREGIIVAADKGALLIEELQPEGKRRMSAQEFIAGHKIRPGEVFGKK